LQRQLEQHEIQKIYTTEADWGEQYVMGDNLEVVWPEFLTLS